MCRCDKLLNFTIIIENTLPALCLKLYDAKADEFQIGHLQSELQPFLDLHVPINRSTYYCRIHSAHILFLPIKE